MHSRKEFVIKNIQIYFTFYLLRNILQFFIVTKRQPHQVITAITNVCTFSMLRFTNVIFFLFLITPFFYSICVLTGFILFLLVLLHFLLFLSFFLFLFFCPFFPLICESSYFIDNKKKKVKFLRSKKREENNPKDSYILIYQLFLLVFFVRIHDCKMQLNQQLK